MVLTSGFLVLELIGDDVGRVTKGMSLGLDAGKIKDRQTFSRSDFISASYAARCASKS